ncbi:11702_t:CDS:2 [Scutellospora calospora]|uniref:11702_t:CDS:1 n=1 Tax=Scutellospora calospora TaxID=85575 RepID=A0ACA9KGP2_9GLOM|nr:11702_t:CDS:2 [Scutellospora calospora]
MAIPQSSVSKFGTCPKCSSPRFHYNWCRKCEFYAYQSLYPKWTCQNQDIDLVIKSIQANAGSIFSFIEYIPYEKFLNIEYIGKGGFSTVWEAEWVDGPRDGPPVFEHQDGVQGEQMPKWERSGQKKVILKSLLASQNVKSQFFEELRILSRHTPPNCTYTIPGLLRCYGITRDPKTHEFMMVFQHCSRYDLQTYLSRIPYTTLLQSHKLISQIVGGLKEIHKSGLIHKNLHSGNILIDENGNAYIGDTGLCKPVDPAKIRRSSEPTKLTFRKRTNSSPTESISQPMNLVNSVFGVMPYLAPETLMSGIYSKSSNVYSLGMILWQIWSGQRPFIERPHDKTLQIEILKNNLRPMLLEDMPTEYKELVSQCLESDPSNRPSIDDIERVLKRMICDDGINVEGVVTGSLGFEIGIKGNGGIRRVLYQERQNALPHRKAKYVSRLISTLNNKTDASEIKSIPLQKLRNSSQSNLLTRHDFTNKPDLGTVIKVKHDQNDPSDNHSNPRVSPHNIPPRTSLVSNVFENTQGSIIILNASGNNRDSRIFTANKQNSENFYKGFNESREFSIPKNNHIIQKLQSATAFQRISSMNRCLIPNDEDFRILIDWCYWAN